MLRQFKINLLQKEIHRLALFLDVDGTLYEIEKSPHLVRPCFKLQKKLHIIRNKLGGALGLISGRTLNDLDRIFDNTQIPVAGNHGAQLRDALRSKDYPANAKNLEEIFYKITKLIGRQNNLKVENKGSNLTVHFRNSTIHRKKFKTTIMKLVKHESELTFLEGKEVLEIKPQHHDKGTAIAFFMKTKPFLNRIPVFIGDDVSDEDGFETINKQGGLSVRVGKYKKSKANYFLPDVKSVHKILNQLLKLW